MDQLLIPLSPLLSGRYQRIAEEENRRLEDVINEALDAHLKQLDEDLWAIVNQRLTPAENGRMDVLMGKNSSGNITESERNELQTLVDKVNQQMLERTEALIELKERGYDINAYLGLTHNDHDS